MCVMFYGVSADFVDDYLEVSENSVQQSFKALCKLICTKFEQEYLREPTENDPELIMAISAAQIFPGCIWSIDFPHREWKNCLIAWAWQFKGKEKKLSIVLKAVRNTELWIWQCFFRSPVSLNEINVLDHSTNMEQMLEGHFPAYIKYELNGEEMTLPYYPADEIYPSWAIFVKAIQEGCTRNE